MSDDISEGKEYYIELENFLHNRRWDSVYEAKTHSSVLQLEHGVGVTDSFTIFSADGLPLFGRVGTSSLKKRYFMSVNWHIKL